MTGETRYFFVLKTKLIYTLILKLCLFSNGLVCKELKAIVIGVENIEYLPYYDGSDSKKPNFTGFSEKLLKQFSREFGYSVKFYPAPLNRLYRDLVAENYIDFKYPDNPQWQKSFKDTFSKPNPIIYSESILNTVTGIASLQQNTTLSDCSRIGKVRGFTSQSYKSHFMKKQIDVVETADTTELISLLLLKRINCIYISKDVLNYKMREEFENRVPVYFHDKLAVDVQSFHLSTVKYPDVIEQFNLYLSTHSDQVRALKQQFDIGL